MQKKFHILVADDNQEVRESVQREITSNFNNCLLKNFESLSEFNELLSTFKPDLIISETEFKELEAKSIIKFATENKPKIQ